MHNGNENKEFDFDPSESKAFLNTLDEVIGNEEGHSGVEDFDLDDDLFDEMDTGFDEFKMEFEKEEAAEKEGKKNPILNFLGKVPTWAKVLVSVVLVILLSVGLLFGTPAGRKIIYNVVVEFLFGQVDVDRDDGEDNPLETPGLTPELTPEPTIDPEATPDAEATPAPTKTPIKDDENVINVLLLGEENIYNAKRGRTDAILLVSIDLRGGDLKIVSFLRDLYVQIPGRSDDRLNAAYSYGGSSLIMQTIENNFKVDIDGYVKVDFSGFMDLIDQLGGLRISLTAQESQYLNTTEYISKKSERNTVAGYQNMTGSQVLGYCRVRYVPTANGLHDDYGRNYRHRVVLQALFDKYKEKSLPELLSIMNQCFDYVTVSEGLKDVAADCLQAVLEEQMFTIQTLQIPQNGHYADARIDGKAVITFYPDNIDILQDFLYDKEE